MTPLDTILVLFLLFTKHFIVDFPLQKPYQWQNKGTYGHPGGILHSGLHFGGTTVVLAFFASYPVALLAGLIDGIIHYHIDWAKMNLNRRMGWRADQHEEFWTLLGLDQYAHAVTYLIIVMLIV